MTTQTTQTALQLNEAVENKMTVKQAVAIASSPETMATLDLEQIEGLIAILETSKDKKVTRKLDMVKGELERRKKEAKGTPAEKEIKAVENSVKQVAKKIVPRGSATAKPKEGETKKPVIKPKASTATKKAEEKAEEKVAFKFPATSPDGSKLVEMKDVKEMQKALLEHPYKLRLYMLEEGMKDLTVFLVTYVNTDVMVLLDLSREINTVAPIDMTTYKNGTVDFDGAIRPVGFYLSK